MLINAPPEEKLDPRVKRTRRLLEEAFSELIREKDFQSVSIQDIAVRAGINRATFYAHFPDKYALLEHQIRQEFRAEIEKRTLNACHFSEDNLRALILTVCEFIGEAPVGRSTGWHSTGMNRKTTTLWASTLKR
ncbi:MAG: TetR/AcrR family transcriptional regulator [Chloroflexi bacterium CFX1]|nr:TetR/AcrR family transcriptional regulator [Chloroflexi bacterium CFX1]